MILENVFSLFLIRISDQEDCYSFSRCKKIRKYQKFLSLRKVPYSNIVDYGHKFQYQNLENAFINNFLVILMLFKK